MDPSVFYRAFRNNPNDIVMKEPGVFRLASSLFKSAAVSVDDGALCDAADTQRRFTRERGEPCGVASLAKSVVAGEGLAVRPEPVPATATTEANPAHALILNVGKKAAAKLSRASAIAIDHPDIRVVAG